MKHSTTFCSFLARNVIPPAIVMILLAFPASMLQADIAITFDLNNGTFVDLPPVGSQTTTYEDVYQSPTFDINETIAPGQSINIMFEFATGPIEQNLIISDSAAFSLPNEGVIFDIFGTGNSDVNFQIDFLGATGSYRSSITDEIQVNDETVLAALGGPEPFSGGARLGEFFDTFPNDPARFNGIALDATQETLMFDGLNLNLFNGGASDITVSNLTFLAVANEVAIVPEPSSLLLFGGLSFVAVVSRRRIRLSLAG